MKTKAYLSVFSIVFGALMVGFSDLAIRAQGLDGKFGLNAHSWDAMGSTMVGIGMFGIVLLLASGDKK